MYLVDITGVRQSYVCTLTEMCLEAHLFVNRKRCLSVGFILPYDEICL